MERNHVIISVIVLVVAVGFVVYRFAIPEEAVREETARTDEHDVESAEHAEEHESLQEVSSTVTYEIPGNRTHTIRFAVELDDEGIIHGLDFVDTTDPEHQENVDEFEANLLPQVEGKKLSELEPFDMVGTSTLTTGAFNDALAEMQAEL